MMWVLAALLLLAACSSSDDESPGSQGRVPSPPSRDVPQATLRPNVLIFVTDDQRESTMRSLPKTRELFQKGGTQFANAYATTPVCCPSRASIMTGLYAHNHGVLNNGEVGVFDQDPTIQRYLKEQGYTTGVIGKFLNLWDVERSPNYFDRWAVIEDDYDHIYYDFTVNLNGNIRKIPNYSTGWIGDTAIDWIKGFESEDDRPWYLYVAPFAPHQPATPEPKYADEKVSLYRGNPGVAERDRADKAPYVRERVLGLNSARDVRRRQLRTLPSVDDMVDSVFETLETYDEDRDTIAIFMSDNGHMWGEHRLASKRWPYLESIKIPFLVRWPGHVEAGGIDKRVVANIDVLPTVLDALGLWPDEAYRADGRSLLGEEERARLHLDNWFYDHGAPDWSGTITRDWQYIEYYKPNGRLAFKEYYDLKADPYQLDNLLADGDRLNDPNMRKLSRQLAEDRKCEVGACP